MPLQTINVQTLKDWLARDEALVLDVQECAEGSTQKLEGAYLLPLNLVNKANLPSLGEKKIVIHCPSSQAGEDACAKLLAEDSTLEIYTLEGGTSAWIEAGYPVLSADSSFISLNRQVRIIFGLFIFILSLLAYVGSPFFALLAALMGLGFAVAGVTGFCWLTHALTKASWNKSRYTPIMK